MPAGNLHKMDTEGTSPVQYSLELSTQFFSVNSWIGKELQVSFSGRINCVACGKITKKSFGQGFCYPCFMNAPQSAPCIVNPELCEAHLGKGRDVAWEERNHAQPHIVYLAYSSAVKVGVTRADQIPTRWIDQGADAATIIAHVPYRKLAGDIEVHLKTFFSDKTVWSKMLTQQGFSDIDFTVYRNKAIEEIEADFEEYICDDDTKYLIQYPLEVPPIKVKSLSLDKENTFKKILSGIKGQYLIFSDSTVLNIRNHSGYWVDIQVSE